jgi:Tol biopolymer transport system component
MNGRDRNRQTGLVRCAAVVLAVVLADHASGQRTTRVSVDSAGVQGNGSSSNPAISADGRFVAFDSPASNLVAGDENGWSDVFVHDRATGVTARVSADPNGLDGNDLSGGDCTSISADGRFVAFVSAASNLVAGDTNSSYDVFVHDRLTGETSRVSVNSAGVEANASCGNPSISADGRFVAFYSFSTNFDPLETFLSADIFVHDCATGVTSLESTAYTGGPAGSCNRPSISDDGRFVAFYSSRGIVSGDSNRLGDIFVRDRETGTTTRVSVDSAGSQSNGESYYPSISGDGRFVAFESRASNLVSNDTNDVSEVFVHDRATGITSRVSVDSAGGQQNRSSAKPAISSDGRFVAFVSVASTLVPRDSNATSDVFVHDQATGVTSRVSVDSAGIQGNSRNRYRPSISADGRFVAFQSDASNLVPNDTNDLSDVFVNARALCRDGTVNASSGSLADVLRVNGSAGDADRLVTASVFAPIAVSLDASPSGPGGPAQPLARYVLWVWPLLPSRSVDMRAGLEVLGCTVNPIPLRPSETPQPFRCVWGTGMSPAACGRVPILPSPARAPWILARATGFSRPLVFTLQAVLEDDGATNATGFSVTNAVVLRVE